MSSQYVLSAKGNRWELYIRLMRNRKGMCPKMGQRLAAISLWVNILSKLLSILEVLTPYDDNEGHCGNLPQCKHE